VESEARRLCLKLPRALAPSSTRSRGSCAAMRATCTGPSRLGVRASVDDLPTRTQAPARAAPKSCHAPAVTKCVKTSGQAERASKASVKSSSWASVASTTLGISRPATRAALRTKIADWAHCASAGTPSRPAAGFAFRRATARPTRTAGPSIFAPPLETLVAGTLSPVSRPKTSAGATPTAAALPVATIRASAGATPPSAVALFWSKTWRESPQS
jgi:hypothetical protein